MALRDMFIAIGYAINPEGLSEANARADAFRNNLLSAETQGQKLGAAIATAGATAKTSMDEATQAASGLAGWWQENEKRVEGWGKQLKEYRGILTGISAATLGTVGFSVKTAADFEAAMSRVAAVSRASEEDLALLTKTARELGATTVFSASQAAEGMTFLAMAGFDTQQIIAAMPGLLDAAAAAGEDLGRTADIVSNILSGFGLAAEETSRIADVLTATFTSSNTTLASLGETMKLVAPVAAALGLEIEEVAALTAVLGDAGIQGSMAGTALRAILSSLAAPSGAAAKAIAELGIQTTDAAGNMLPITTILAQIAQKTAHMGDAQRAAVFEALAGREAVSALSAIMAVGSSRIDEYADSLRNSAGISAEVAARQMDNLRGAVAEMRSAIEGAQISIGNAFIPVLRIGARALTAMVNVFNKLPAPIQTTIAVTMGVVGVLSSMALAASFIIPQIGTMVKGFGLLKTGLAAVGAIGAKAGAAIAAAWLPVTLTIGAVVAAGLLLQDVWLALRGEGDTLTARMFNWGARMLGLSTTWEDAIANMRARFSAAWQQFRENPISFIIDWSPFGLLRRGTEALLNWFSEWLAERNIRLPEIQLPTLPDLVAWIMTPINALMEYLGSIDIGSAIGDAISSAWDYITSPLESLTGWIRGWFPQSPAKYGPLSDIDQIGPDLVDTIAGSLERANLRQLEDSLSGVTTTMDPTTDNAVSAGRPGVMTSPVAAGLGSIDVTVHVDARGATAADAEQVGQTTADKIREVLDQWVRENFYSVALQEV